MSAALDDQILESALRAIGPADLSQQARDRSEPS